MSMKSRRFVSGAIGILLIGAGIAAMAQLPEATDFVTSAVSSVETATKEVSQFFEGSDDKTIDNKVSDQTTSDSNAVKELIDITNPQTAN